MTKFSNKFKKPCFWPNLGPFSQFLGQKTFSWKIRLCHAQLHMSFQHHAKIQKKLMLQFKENAWTGKRMDRRTDRPCLGVQKWPKWAARLEIEVRNLQYKFLYDIQISTVFFFLQLKPYYNCNSCPLYNSKLFQVFQFKKTYFFKIFQIL